MAKIVLNRFKLWLSWDKFLFSPPILQTPKKYTGKGFHLYLSDAHYALAMVALRRGSDENAQKYLWALNEASVKDQEVDLFYGLLPPDSGDVKNAVCNSRSLAAATLEIIDKEKSFSGRTNMLRQWHRSNCKAP